MTRIESASSINIYKQCPRRYYYSYIEQISVLPNIYCVRGNAVHSTLEEFFKMDVKGISKENYEFELAIIAHEIFKKEWTKKKRELMQLKLSKPKLEFFKKESQDMLNNWLRRFFKKLKKEIKDKNFTEAFEKLRPETELYLESEEFKLRGYIDALHKIEDKIILMDYKTSAKDDFRDEYRLQMAIYCLLYYDKFGKIPHQVGIDFLRHGEKMMDVNEELLEFAKKEALLMQENTTTDKIEDYPKIKTRLCDWCDFSEFCNNKQ